MKQTATRNYPYPECNPPFVKDAADLPLQLKNFAELVDDDVTAAQAAALDALNPPSASISANPTTLNANSRHIYNTIDWDNGTPTIADTVNSGLRINSAGLYHICAFRLYTNSAVVGAQLSIVLNGAIVDTVSIAPGAAAVNVQLAVQTVQLLAVNDFVSTFGVEPNNTADGLGRLSLVRIVKT